MLSPKRQPQTARIECGRNTWHEETDIDVDNRRRLHTACRDREHGASNYVAQASR